jgi:hypothetical protein
VENIEASVKSGTNVNEVALEAAPLVTVLVSFLAGLTDVVRRIKKQKNVKTGVSH